MSTTIDIFRHFATLTCIHFVSFIHKFYDLVKPAGIVSEPEVVDLCPVNFSSFSAASSLGFEVAFGHRPAKPTQIKIAM